MRSPVPTWKWNVILILAGCGILAAPQFGVFVDFCCFLMLWMSKWVTDLECRDWYFFLKSIYLFIYIFFSHVITKVIQDYNLRLQLVLFLTAHLSFSINDTFAKTEKKKHNRLWQLTEFNLPKTLMLHFYTSILTSSITIWYSEATAKDKGRLQSAISPGPVHLQDPEACRWTCGKPMGGEY